ncbi:LPXTG cell wall anchor domain-containing protein [Paucilactobacillus nenjiangensis]|uniref:LPXTG cell wall anchor domain-containing protein n=1 Tax=Paucilactobacillus nenjiangensis TaxID=1296540 RepID=A0A5P1X4F6_9LACO|nr:LPXTG cell wall anchor domain-containing protein [Paucilactobacillus nenjiangensis]
MQREVLPQTDETIQNELSVLGMMLLGFMGISVGIRKKKR